MNRFVVPAAAAAVCIFAFSAFAGGLGKSAITPTQSAIGPGGPSVSSGQAAAAVISQAPGAAAVPAVFDPAHAAVPDDARVMMVLEGGRSEDHGTLSVYTRDADANGALTSWTRVLETNAMYGKNGLYKEVEGDCKTPVGIFRMNTPFGISPKQEGFPDNYIQVDDRYYWNGDSDSPMYNRFVRSDIFTEFRKESSEHLIDYGGYYNYCIDSGYNPDGIPRKGSAIFLHCSVNGENTHGCIAIPEESMVSAMKLYREGRSWMVIYDRENAGAVLR